MDRRCDCTRLVSDPWFLKTVQLTRDRVAALEGWFLYQADWDQAVEDAQNRNAAG
jgi:hypothetical protein